MIKKIAIEDIEVGVPLFLWLLDRIDDDYFKDKHWDIYGALCDSGFYSKESYLDFLEEKYENYLNLPILVEKKNDDRYKIRDGRRRLSVLHSRKNVKTVDCIIVEDHWTKVDWEAGILFDLAMKNKTFIKDIIPQIDLIHGFPPYDMYFLIDGEKKYIDSFLIATGLEVPYILMRSDSYEARGDNFVKPKHQRPYELLLGIGKHEPIAKEWGTYPLDGYLVGHFACGPNAEIDPLVKQFGRFVRIQQYFRGGYWGKDVPGYEFNGIPTVKEQIAQNEIAIPMLFKLGILRYDTQVYFADQSADKPCPLHQYFKLFKGNDILSQYYAWLPTYLRTCRKNDFNVPIEEVIKWIPQI